MAYGRIALLVLALVAVLVWFVPSYYTGLLTQIGLYALVAIGLNLFMGYAGQVSLGQAAFMGIGAYTSAALAVKAHVTPWLGLVAGAFVAALVAYVLSFVALRLRENLLALATLALGIVINVVFNEWDFIGGSSGFKDIPGFSIGAYAFDQRAYAVLAWALVAIGIWFAGNLVRSSFGRALVAISAGELGAQALGVHADRLKRQTFVLSAVYAGVAGAVYASSFTYIDPTSFSFLLSVNFVLMSVIGGIRSLWGAVIGALVVVALGQVLQSAVPIVLPSARGDFQSFFLGAILIAMLILLPRGITSRFGEARA
ncbi:MAG TPA: branched-chain amino acid ABC transporter permease [Candidatus Elarobacter sp.]|jgi:branched-chain amino acid transport system permease protein|nr:branched-chain amino acid ABC transporter permease [Candidatus Elarobacter sp.]